MKMHEVSVFLERESRVAIPLSDAFRNYNVYPLIYGRGNAKDVAR